MKLDLSNPEWCALLVADGRKYKAMSDQHFYSYLEFNNFSSEAKEYILANL